MNHHYYSFHTGWSSDYRKCLFYMASNYWLWMCLFSRESFLLWIFCKHSYRSIRLHIDCHFCQICKGVLQDWLFLQSITVFRLFFEVRRFWAFKNINLILADNTFCPWKLCSSIFLCNVFPDYCFLCIQSSYSHGFFGIGIGSFGFNGCSCRFGSLSRDWYDQYWEYKQQWRQQDLLDFLLHVNTLLSDKWVVGGYCKYFL